MAESKLRIGITGQSGFVGTYLFNALGILPDRYKRVTFLDDYFKDENLLNQFVRECDVIVHLAAVNRHVDDQILYSINIQLVNQLIMACENTSTSPHIIFSSSIQEDRSNLYGKSKKEGRRLLGAWAKRNNSRFTGLVIPNVFGPFGQPFYNSVVATFCHQLTHGERPLVNLDGMVRLIYVGELVSQIIDIIEGPPVSSYETNIEASSSIGISKLSEKLTSYRDTYLDKGSIPELGNQFDLNLFNTFLSYIDHSKFFPFFLTTHSDSRGLFVETMKLNSGGQISFSTTKTGVTRGNHFHTRKAERFAVIKGKAKIEIRRVGTNNKQTFNLDGESPSFVDMPIWHTHNITNIGDDELYTIFWINEHFNPDDPDTYFEEV
ncbi:MAG: SDR family oxidoreductase [Bacteroidetes bacterium]|jgi:UDP-2-acetamido-2,6-beta-L-arabino-hexul-4-ose reductase|nr:SDR family oxidoreductase [Bacteroidota bacterium]